MLRLPRKLVRLHTFPTADERAPKRLKDNYLVSIWLNYVGCLEIKLESGEEFGHRRPEVGCVERETAAHANA